MIESTLSVYFMDRVPSYLPGLPSTRKKAIPSLSTSKNGTKPGLFVTIARNTGPNPIFGALHSSNSIFGKSHDIWLEGEGMLHALYFAKSSNNTWSISCTNRYVQTDTFRLEKGLQKPRFLPANDGDPPAMLIASVLNTVSTKLACRCH